MSVVCPVVSCCHFLLSCHVLRGSKSTVLMATG